MLPNARRAKSPASPEELVLAIRRWWKSKEKNWGDLSYGTRFWTPEEWAAKGERFGNKALVNLTSEGGFNRILCYGETREDARLVEQWNRLIESLGWWWETNTCWAFSFYPKKTSNPARRNGGKFSCQKCGARARQDSAFCADCDPQLKVLVWEQRRRHRELVTYDDAADDSHSDHAPRRAEGADQPISVVGFQSLGAGKRRRWHGVEGNEPKRRNATCPTCGAKDAYVSPFSGKIDCRCSRVVCAECGARDMLEGKCPTCGGIYCSGHSCIVHTECFACGVAMTARTGSPCGCCGEAYCWACYGKKDPDGEVCSRCYAITPNPRRRR